MEDYNEDSIIKKGEQIAEYFGCKIIKTLSGKNNFNGYVFLLDNEKIMKISNVICSDVIEDLKENNYINIYQHILFSINPSRQYDVYIRDNINDVPKESFNFSNNAFHVLKEAMNCVREIFGFTVDEFDFSCFKDFMLDMELYHDLTFEERQHLEKYIEAVTEFNSVTGKIYCDICEENFGILNGKYIVRDFEGFYGAFENQHANLQDIPVVTLDDLNNNTTKSLKI